MNKSDSNVLASCKIILGPFQVGPVNKRKIPYQISALELLSFPSFLDPVSESGPDLSKIIGNSITFRANPNFGYRDRTRISRPDEQWVEFCLSPLNLVRFKRISSGPGPPKNHLAQNVSF